MKRIVLAYLGIVLFAIAPLLITIVSISAAQALGCQIDEGSSHPCMIFGLDSGPAFYVLAVFGWLTIVTLPLAAIALVGLTIILAIRRLRKRAAPPLV